MTLHPAALLLGTTRAAVGATAWTAPRTTLRLTGLGPATRGPEDATASTDVVSRLFGVRDLALGLAVLQTDPHLRRAALALGVAVDLVDAAASVQGVRRGAPPASLLGVAAGALLFAGLGAGALRGAGR